MILKILMSDEMGNSPKHHTYGVVQGCTGEPEKVKSDNIDHLQSTIMHVINPVYYNTFDI